jgi:hypothetical protein
MYVYIQTWVLFSCAYKNAKPRIGHKITPCKFLKITSHTAREIFRRDPQSAFLK